MLETPVNQKTCMVTIRENKNTSGMDAIHIAQLATGNLTCLQLELGTNRSNTRKYSQGTKG